MAVVTRVLLLLLLDIAAVSVDGINRQPNPHAHAPVSIATQQQVWREVMDREWYVRTLIYHLAPRPKPVARLH